MTIFHKYICYDFSYFTSIAMPYFITVWERVDMRWSDPEANLSTTVAVPPLVISDNNNVRILYYHTLSRFIHGLIKNSWQPILLSVLLYFNCYIL